jgi:hypothetical protein
MRLSVVRNLILKGCLDDIPASGFLVIDAVGLRSMYFVAMPSDKGIDNRARQLSTPEAR